MIKHLPQTLLFFVCIGLCTVVQSAVAGPASTLYELKDYSFGAGGTDDSGSNQYSLFGVAGEIDSGLVAAVQANLPPAPTFTNPAATYERLKCIINTGGNPTDSTYAIAISDDDWLTTRYVQDDATIGDVLGTEDWLTYTGWGGTSGRFITGLTGATSYNIKVRVRQGKFTETGWGPSAQAATDIPSLTFGISSDTVLFDPLTGQNAYTDASKSTTFTTSTNAYHGYTIYGRHTGPLTFAQNTIPDFGSPNAAPSVWSGIGFGYTTADANLAGGTADRFTNGGPKYAGFTTAAPGDPVADHTEIVEDAPIVNEQSTVSYRVSVSEGILSGDYTNTVLYVVVPIY